jgi:ABC-type transporter Mla MlaB component
VLYVIAEGCAEAMRKNLVPLLELDLNVMKDFDSTGVILLLHLPNSLSTYNQIFINTLAL